MFVAADSLDHWLRNQPRDLGAKFSATDVDRLVSEIAGLRSQGIQTKDVQAVLAAWKPYLREADLQRASQASERSGFSAAELRGGHVSAELQGKDRTTIQAIAALRSVLPEPSLLGLIEEACHDRLLALNAPDRSPGSLRALDHIIALARAGQTVDGRDAKSVAIELLRQAGAPRDTAWGRCYGRTLYAIYAKHHPGELARLIRDLALSGRVTLASKDVVHWDPKACPIEETECSRTHGNPVSSFLFGVLVNNIRLKDLPPDWHLSLEPHNHDLATPRYFSGLGVRGQLANIEARLWGEPFVDVAPGGPGDWAARVAALVRKNGPMLASYRAGASDIDHGGSLAGVAGGTFLSLEQDGSLVPEPAEALLYLIAPKRQAEALGLSVIRYLPDDPCGYRFD